MKRTLVALLLTILLTNVVLAGDGTIESVEVQGLFRMTPEAFRHALGVKAGDPFDPDQLRARFKALWGLGLFEDIRMEAEATPDGGTLLVVKVKERPILTSVTYQESNEVTRTEIEDRLKERGFRLELGKPIDVGTISFAETAIRDLLGEKGFLDAEVEAEVRTVTETSRAVHFSVIAGGKTRILKIDFQGNELFPERRLKSRLQLTQERKWYWPWSAKNLYHPAKWDQDVASVRELYQNQGYLDIEIRPPVVEVRKSKQRKKAKQLEQTEKAEAESDAGDVPPPLSDDAELTPKQRKKAEKKRSKQEEKRLSKVRKSKKIKRWVYLTASVAEGPQYTLGELTIEGNQKIKDEVLRGLIPLKTGAVLRNDRLQGGIDAINRRYEDLGHLYATVVRRIKRREGDPVADVEISIDEDKPYYVGRIEFLGNSATHDRVLRRELVLTEGQLFSRTRLDFSRHKINQLGYFQVTDEPLIEPVEGESRVNVTLPGEERGRNEIQIGGGYSGLDGAFFNGVYSTRNFLGRGQILSTAIQVGGRSNRYQIQFQEPWFLNRPYSFGVSIYRRELDYGASLRSTSDGGGLLLGRRVGRYGSARFSYNWERVSSRQVLIAADGSATDTSEAFNSENRVSSLTPAYAHDTINNPFRPTRGRLLSLSMQIAGGPLGGDTSFLKPIGTFTGYRRGPGRTYLGAHVQVGLVRKWQGGSDLQNTSDIGGVPLYQRFWLGGDTLGPRAFETRSITPLRYVKVEGGRIVEVLGDPRYMSPDDFYTSGGVPALVEVGGDRFFLIQSEWVLPLNEQAELALFVDAGDALFEDQSWGFATARVSTGVELRFHLPIFPVPLRLIYGIPVRELRGDETSNFTFSIGRSF